jgi:hypothetical protein
MIGESLNVIVFLSLKTFQQSSCAFYLTIVSAVNVGRLLSTALGYIIRWGFGIDWGVHSLFYCKFRLFMFLTGSLSSMTCLCLATIDQYFATSTRPRWQQWCNIELAHRLTTIFVIIWILHDIPSLVCNNHVILPLTNQITCQITSNMYNQYMTYGYYLILANLLPFITVVFG